LFDTTASLINHWLRHKIPDNSGYSRRLFTHAYRNEKLATLLDGHERAFRHFGGVTLTCLYDNPRTLVLGRSENRVV
jgi:transposase